MKDATATHYQRLAQNYDTFLYYSPRFVRTQTAKMIDKLELEPDDVFVDLGCGTGMYTLDILQQVRFKHDVLCVDPFPEMLDWIPEKAPVERVCMDGLTFSKEPFSFDKMLIKEAVHHIPDRKALFDGLYQHLSAGGMLLLVHVPPEVRYPLFQAALDRCRTWHADPDELISLLCKSGFEVGRDGLDYVHEIPKERYFEMVAGRYMSVLSTFEDDELAKGLDEIEERYANEEVLRFVDHFDFITARKTVR